LRYSLGRVSHTWPRRLEASSPSKSSIFVVMIFLLASGASYPQTIRQFKEALIKTENL
jgi:hypothetical protein